MCVCVSFSILSLTALFHVLFFYSEFPSLLNCQIHIQPSELCFRAMTSVRPAATTPAFVISLQHVHQDWIIAYCVILWVLCFSPQFDQLFLFSQCPAHGLVTKCSVNVCWGYKRHGASDKVNIPVFSLQPKGFIFPNSSHGLGFQSWTEGV